MWRTIQKKANENKEDRAYGEEEGCVTELEDLMSIIFTIQMVPLYMIPYFLLEHPVLFL